MTYQPPVIARPGRVVLCLGGGHTMTPEEAEALAAELIRAAFDARALRKLIEAAPRSVQIRA